jgi:small subunit ribosomal protein S16
MVEIFDNIIFSTKIGKYQKMVAIRLMRLGAKKKPFYRIVVTDSRMPRESKAKEILGYYDPMKEPPDIKVDLERAKYWLDKGAQASNTVQSLLHKVSKSAKQPNNKT